MEMLLNRMNHMIQCVCVRDFVRGAVGYCSGTNGGYRKLEQRVTVYKSGLEMCSFSSFNPLKKLTKLDQIHVI